MYRVYDVTKNVVLFYTVAQIFISCHLIYFGLDDSPNSSQILCNLFVWKSQIYVCYSPNWRLYQRLIIFNMVYLPFKNPVIDIATDTILNQTFQYIHSYIKCNISTYILNKYFTLDRFLPTFVLIAMYSHVCGNKSQSSSGITCKIHGLNQDNQLMSVFLSIRFVGALCLDRNMHMLLMYLTLLFEVCIGNNNKTNATTHMFGEYQRFA